MAKLAGLHPKHKAAYVLTAPSRSRRMLMIICNEPLRQVRNLLQVRSIFELLLAFPRKVRKRDDSTAPAANGWGRSSFRERKLRGLAFKIRPLTPRAHGSI